jgi:hypothetical protein
MSFIPFWCAYVKAIPYRSKLPNSSTPRPGLGITRRVLALDETKGDRSVGTSITSKGAPRMLDVLLVAFSSEFLPL